MELLSTQRKTQNVYEYFEKFFDNTLAKNASAAHIPLQLKPYITKKVLLELESLKV